MKVLIYGNGAREHALAWKLSKSAKIENIFAISPNPLMEEITAAVNLSSYKEIANFCKKEKIDFVVIGPEKPLADGFVNILDESGIQAFGPSQEFAWLESSKSLSKDFNRRNSILCADALNVETMGEAKKQLKLLNLLTF